MNNGIQKGKDDAAKYGDPVEAKADDKSYLAGFFLAMLILGFGIATVAFMAEMAKACAFAFAARVRQRSSGRIRS